MFRLALVLLTGALASTPFGVDRAYLQALNDKHSLHASDFTYPFLISQTAMLSPLAPSEAANRLETYLKKTALTIAGHGRDAKASRNPPVLDAITLPSAAVSGDQLAAIEKCNHEKCLMKLLTASEKKEMESSPDKVKTFQQLIRERVRTYLVDNKLVGYEDRPDNVPFVGKMMENLPFVRARYPDVANFFAAAFWKKEMLPQSFAGSFLREEILLFGLQRLQPILRIGEVFAFNEGAARVYFELHVYTDHYFDSSARIYEVLPSADKSAIVVTDIMEIDELTKSDFIRFLFQDQMESAVRRFQTEELDSIYGSHKGVRGRDECPPFKCPSFGVSAEKRNDHALPSTGAA